MVVPCIIAEYSTISLIVRVFPNIAVVHLHGLFFV